MKRPPSVTPRSLLLALQAVEADASSVADVADALVRDGQDDALLWMAEVGGTDVERKTLEIIRGRGLIAIAEARAALPGLRRDLRQVEAILAAVAIDARYTLPPYAEPPLERDCVRCGLAFPIQRSDARYCSPRCRVAAKRVRDRQTVEP